MIDESLAALSDPLFSVSVGLYSLAVVAFCAILTLPETKGTELR